MPTDLLIDGNSLYARAWFATIKNDPAPSANEPIRSAICTILGLLNPNTDKLGERIDRVLIGWDGPNKRDKGRDPKPQEYHTAKELLKEYLEFLFKPAQVQLDSREADDVVATAAKQSDAETIYIVSGDKDLQQLANDHVHYYCLNTKAVLSLRSIRDKWNVKQPDQIAIALAILGEKVDNIPGIHGWGPKKVKKLFEAVTPGMSLSEAFQCVEQQMIDAGLAQDVLDGFYNDMDLTLLNPDLPGVPPAAPVDLAPLEAVQELQLPNFMDYYRPVYRLYTSRVQVTADGDEEDVPEY